MTADFINGELKMKGILISIFAIIAATTVAFDSAMSLPLGGTLFPEQEEEYNVQGISMTLRFQNDGNLVVYNKQSFYNGTGGSTALWASGTEGRKIEYVTYRQGEIQFINNGSIVHRVNVGQGSQVCLTNAGQPVGCQ
jgi:hypothetical protein